MSRSLIIALGGNAILRKGEDGKVSEQFAHTRDALSGIVNLLKREYKVLLTHGNGPQVGNMLIRVRESKEKAYPLPLGVCVAATQGEMGYMISQCLDNKLKDAGFYRDVVCILTQVVVDKDDPSIQNPTKPIGPFLNVGQAENLRLRNIPVIEDAGRGYRRVVPSPLPIRIFEAKAIKSLYQQGFIVIASGGGGIPIYTEVNGWLEGVDAVIDKDFATALLGNRIEAEEMIILTGVEKVCLNFNTPEEKVLTKLSISQAKEYLEAGQFPSGSMGPKIQAAINFLENGGKRVVITSTEKVVEGVDGIEGTEIYKEV